MADAKLLQTDPDIFEIKQAKLLVIVLTHIPKKCIRCSNIKCFVVAMVGIFSSKEYAYLIIVSNLGGILIAHN